MTLLEDTLYKYSVDNVNETFKGTKLICKLSKQNGDYLHIVFEGLDSYGITFINDLLSKKCYTYINFLEYCNGCILYSGGLNLFGITDTTSLDFEFPSSIERETEFNAYASSHPELLYIGNIMHRSGSNVDIFLDKKEGSVYLILMDNLIETYDSFETFLDFIINFYDNHYDNTGHNFDENDRTKNVYGNTQLF